MRVVYQGTLSTNGGHYDLRRLFEEIAAEGVELDVFPSRPVPAYEELAGRHATIRCHPTVDPRRLLRELPRYDFGWAGFNDSLNRAHLETVLPNKVYEYLGCGLPVLTLRHRALSRFVDETGVGLSLDGVPGLAELLSGVDLAELRRRVAAVRREMTVEANIDRLGGLYEELLARPRLRLGTTNPA